MWRSVVCVISCLVLLGATGCGASRRASSATALADDRITVGAFDFAESGLLAELYAQALERAGFRVDRRFDLGPRELVEPALLRGLVEVVPEYEGSALEFLGGQASASGRKTHRALVDAMSARGVTVLESAPAQDRNAFAVTSTTAATHDLRSLSDLSGVSAQLALGGPPECPDRPLCAQGLRDVYGLGFARFVPLDAGGPLTVSALRSGAIDVGVVFTTDPAIDTQGLVTLRDDRGLEPAENVTPVVRREVIDRFGAGVTDALNEVSAALTTIELRTMNGQIAGGSSAAAVAREWLDRHGVGTD